MDVRTEKIVSRHQDLPLFVLLGQIYVPIKNISSITFLEGNRIEVFFVKEVRMKVEEVIEGTDEVYENIECVTSLVMGPEETEFFMMYFKELMYPHPAETTEDPEFENVTKPNSYIEAAKYLYIEHKESFMVDEYPEWEELEPEDQSKWVRLALTLRGEGRSKEEDSALEMMDIFDL